MLRIRKPRSLLVTFLLVSNASAFAAQIPITFTLDPETYKENDVTASTGGSFINTGVADNGVANPFAATILGIKPQLLPLGGDYKNDVLALDPNSTPLLACTKNPLPVVGNGDSCTFGVSFLVLDAMETPDNEDTATWQFTLEVDYKINGGPLMGSFANQTIYILDDKITSATPEPTTGLLSTLILILFLFRNKKAKAKA